MQTENSNFNKDEKFIRWFITINNPVKYGFSDERVETLLSSIHQIMYYCYCHEISREKETPHLHIYFSVRGDNAINFYQVKSLFASANISPASGTPLECYEYISKTGKWAGTDKAKTQVFGSFKEWGIHDYAYPYNNNSYSKPRHYNKNNYSNNNANININLIFSKITAIEEMLKSFIHKDISR
jgi:hypothetical protein